MDDVTTTKVLDVKEVACWKYFDPRFDECARQCYVAHLCKKATEMRLSNVEPPVPVPPMQLEMPPPVEPPDPFDYLIESLEGNHDVVHKVNGEMDVYKVSKDYAIMGRIVRNKDGRVQVASHIGGKEYYDVDDLAVAEAILKTHFR